MNKIVGFEHLHRHSDFSLLDGYGTVEEYAKYSKQVNQKYLCISDHGAMGAIPSQISYAEKYGLNPIFACELYYNPKQPECPLGKKTTEIIDQIDDNTRQQMQDSFHLLAIAYTSEGYSNLVKMCSWGYLHGFYRKPRVNHETLMKHKKGIIFTSCCYASEIGKTFDRHGEDAAFSCVEKYREMFGEDFYLEIMLLDFKKQKPYDQFIIKAHERYGIPLIVTNDVHYCKKEDSDMQRLMLMIQTKRTIQDIDNALAQSDTADLFELQDKNLWMKSEEELNEKWLSDYSDVIDYEYFAAGKMNTVKICEKAKNVKFDTGPKLPTLPDDKEQLKELMIKGAKWRNIPKTKVYMDRLTEEYNLICKKGYASYFLIQKMMTDYARSINPNSIGPGRGSGGGSLMNYVLGIFDVDPIKHDLLFSRFLSPVRGGLQMKTKFKNQPTKRVRNG